MAPASNDNQQTIRDQPSFVTISFSHYCEKARWGLDLVGAPYRERGHLPLFHFLPVAVATRGAKDRGSDATSTPYSTPVLVTEKGQRICDSTRILQYLSETYGIQLYDPPEALELDHYFSEKLGPHTRRFGYHHLLADVPLLRKFFWSLDNKPQAAGALLLRPLYSRAMRRALRIDEQGAERSKRKILDVLARVEERLLDGRPYLCGNHFSAADLSFSALLAPCLLLTREEGYGSAFPSMEETGGPLATFASEIRARPGGQFALDMYRRHRGVSAASS